MTQSLLVAATLLFAATLHATDDFPTPGGASGNLEKVKVQAVIPSIQVFPEMGAEVEASFKKALTAKNLWVTTKADFAVLSPEVHCAVPYGATGNERLCQVFMTYTEHVPPPKPVKAARQPWGLVTTYRAYYTTTFPEKKEVLAKAIDKLLEHFMREATAKR